MWWRATVSNLESDMNSEYDIGAPACVPGAAEVVPDLLVLEQVRGDLDDVDVALRHLDDGTYGRCEACGEPIEEDRLATRPATRLCADHRQESANG